MTEAMTAKIRVLVKCLYSDSLTIFLKQKMSSCYKESKKAEGNTSSPSQPKSSGGLDERGEDPPADTSVQHCQWYAGHQELTPITLYVGDAQVTLHAGQDKVKSTDTHDAVQHGSQAGSEKDNFKDNLK